MNFSQKDLEIIAQVANMIEKGSEGMKQCAGAYGRYNENREVVEVCSLGACLHAKGLYPIVGAARLNVLLELDYWPTVIYPDEASWPYANTDEGRTISLYSALIWLNDKAGWDFAHIVSWLRGLVMSNTVEPKALENA